LRFNPTLTGAVWQTPTNYSAGETAVESDKTATGITGGEPIFEGLTVGGTNFSRALGTQNELDLDFNGLQPVTLAVRTFSGTGSVSAVLRVREEW